MPRLPVIASARVMALGRALMVALLGATAGLAATGCTSPRAGVGLPMAVIYKNYKTPLTVARPEEGGPPPGAGGRPAVSTSEGRPSTFAGGPPPGASAGGPPPGGPKGIVIPPGLKLVKVSTYSLSPLNIPGIPGGGLISFGWGDMSERRWLEEGGMERFVYADARDLEILRIFNKVTIYAWGVPEEVAAVDDSAQTPPPGVIGEQLDAGASSGS